MKTQYFLSLPTVPYVESFSLGIQSDFNSDHSLEKIPRVSGTLPYQKRSAIGSWPIAAFVVEESSMKTRTLSVSNFYVNNFIG